MSKQKMTTRMIDGKTFHSGVLLAEITDPRLASIMAAVVESPICLSFQIRHKNGRLSVEIIGDDVPASFVRLLEALNKV